MRYRLWFQIRLEHSYFRDGVCPDLQLHPSEKTDRLLRGHRLEMRKQPGGLQVLCPVDEADKPFLPFGSPPELEFALETRGPKFQLITDLSAWSTSHLPLLQNQAGASGVQVLNPVPGPEPHPRTGNLLGKLVLQPGDGSNGWADPAPEFRIRFTPNSTTWKYFLITQTNGQDLELVDKGNRYTFQKKHLSAGADLSALPPDAYRKRAISSLENRFPDHQRYLFESDSPIEFSEAGYKGLQLLKGALPLLKDLSNPLPEHNGIYFIMK